MTFDIFFKNGDVIHLEDVAFLKSVLEVSFKSSVCEDKLCIDMSFVDEIKEVTYVKTNHEKKKGSKNFSKHR